MNSSANPPSHQLHPISTLIHDSSTSRELLESKTFLYCRVRILPVFPQCWRMGTDRWFPGSCSRPGGELHAYGDSGGDQQRYVYEQSCRDQLQANLQRVICLGN